MKIFMSIVLTISMLFIVTIQAVAVEYKPEISGNFENGNKAYIDVFELEDEFSDDITEVEEEIDTYQYNKVWLRFKQKLNKSDYYYIKAQYNNREYQERINYNNIALYL